MSKTIFITGVGSGIGRAAAMLFHEQGWFIGGCDANQASLEALSRELQERNAFICLDVRDKLALEVALADFCDQANGALDIMFNNAGIATGGYFEDVPYEKTVDMVNINLVGVLN